LRDPYSDGDSDRLLIERVADVLWSLEVLLLTGIITIAWLVAATGWVRLGALPWLALFGFVAFKLVCRERED
jgi:hypothetical protein